MNMNDLKLTIATVSSLFLVFVAVEARYAKASELDRLVRSSEQKIVWDLEENIEKGDSVEEQERWFRRLKEKLAEFCADWPDEDECKLEYLEDIEELIDDD